MARRSRKNVGVIGLGIIGSRVANNLRDKGFHVFVWNRSPRPVPNFVGAPMELAEMCDHLQIFVSDDDALLDVTRQIAPALAPRHIVMAHSTVAPQSMRAAADMVERRGARFVEAPFTGSKLGAEKGELVYYVAGDDAALREARPILEASSKEIIEIGQIGQATVIKIATNMITAAVIQAAAEALALTKSSGVPLEKFASAMASNATNSGTLAMKLPKMIEENFEPHFSVKHMLKDMQIASRVGLLNHLELSVAAATRDRLLEQAQRGFADEDYSALVRKYFQPVSSAAEEETTLDLFEQQPEPSAIPMQVADPIGIGSPPAEEAVTVAPVPENMAPAETPPPQVQSEQFAAAEADSVTREPEINAVTPNEHGDSTSPPEGESESGRRGLFDRLLRRGEA